MLSSMKNKNKRDLEKYWAEQAAKKAKVLKKKADSQTEKSNASKDEGTATTSE